MVELTPCAASAVTRAVRAKDDDTERTGVCGTEAGWGALEKKQMAHLLR